MQSIPDFDFQARLMGDVSLTEGEVVEVVENMIARLDDATPYMFMLRAIPNGYHVRMLGSGSRGGRESQAWFNEALELERLE